MLVIEMLRRSAEHVMTNMVISIFERFVWRLLTINKHESAKCPCFASRLKTLEDEWVYVESPDEAKADDPAKESFANDPIMHTPHMSAPTQSPLPAPQYETEKAEEDTPANNAIPTEFGVLEQDRSGDTNNVVASHSVPQEQQAGADTAKPPAEEEQSGNAGTASFREPICDRCLKTWLIYCIKTLLLCGLMAYRLSGNFCVSLYLCLILMNINIQILCV